MPTEIARGMLLNTNGENDVLSFSLQRECQGLCLRFSGKSVQILESCRSQQKVPSTDAMVTGTANDRNEDEKEESLCLFDFSTYVDILYAFLGCKLLIIDDGITGETIIQLGYLDALVATGLTCLEQRKINARQKQERYLETFTSHVSETVIRIFVHVRSFV